MSAQDQFLSLASVSRRLDLPYARLYSLVKAGTLVPHSRIGNAFLFKASSIARVERALATLKLSAGARRDMTTS